VRLMHLCCPTAFGVSYFWFGRPSRVCHWITFERVGVVIKLHIPAIGKRPSKPPSTPTTGNPRGTALTTPFSAFLNDYDIPPSQQEGIRKRMRESDIYPSMIRKGLLTRSVLQDGGSSLVTSISLTSRSSTAPDSPAVGSLRTALDTRLLASVVIRYIY
jgi:hypothetical protein